MSRSLDTYRRTFTPDLEVAPRDPVCAVDLVSPKGVPFTLVRESPSAPEAVTRDLAWLIWRGDACVGYVGGNLVSRYVDPFLRPSAPYTSRRQLKVGRAFAIWRTHIVDGTGQGTGAGVLARVPSRGLGIMTGAYLEIIRQLSCVGWSLRSNPRARSADARALWARIASAPGVEMVRSRAAAAPGREFAFMLAATLARRPAPVAAPTGAGAH